MIRKFFSFQKVDDANKWCLHNPLKNWTLTELTGREVSLIVETLSLPEKRSVLIAAVGGNQWKSLEEEQEWKQSVKINLKLTPALPESTQQDEKSLPNKNQKVITDREHARIALETTAQVICGSQSVSMLTEDISLGGIKFKEALPIWVAGYFTLIIQLENKNFELTCLLVEDQKLEKKRIAFVETDDEESQLPLFKEYFLKMAEKLA